MTTTIYFVRHAHSIYTPDELGRPLSTQGFEDANKITNILMKEKIDAVLSSPYKRAIQTVEGVAENFNKSITLMDGFKERQLAEGEVENFHQAIEKVWSEETFAWPGGESNKEAQFRGVLAMREVLASYKNQSVVIGTHGNIMVLIMQAFDPKFDFKFWQKLKMPDIYKLSFEQDTLTNVSHLDIYK